MECTRSEKNHTVVVCAPKIVCAPHRFRFAVEIYSCCCWLVRFCKGCLLRTEGGAQEGALQNETKVFFLLFVPPR